MFRVILGLRVWREGSPFLIGPKGLQFAWGFYGGRFRFNFDGRGICRAKRCLWSGPFFRLESSDGFAARLDELVRDTGLAEGSRAVVQNTNETEAVGTVDFEHAISASWNSLSAEVVEPVWNTGFWRCIFGGQSLGESLEQSFKRPVPVGEIDVAGETAEETGKKQRVLQQHDLTGPLFQRCVKSSDNSSWQEKREAQLQTALKHWLVLISAWDQSVEFVRCVMGCDSTNSKLIMLGDVFRGKAPSTLSKRANSMKQLCHSLELMGEEFPCNEQTLYSVLCEFRKNGFSVSRSKGVLESIAFVRYTMGILECDPLLQGRRCWGAATSDEPTQKRQASPLQVKELEKLHEVLEKDTDIWNRMFCGTTLFMVYSRSRWSDAQHGSKIQFDGDGEKIHYVEVLTGLHKTMKALQHRHQYLPLVAPAVGVTSQNWAELWMAVRKELGLDFELGHPLMPAPMSDGAPGRRALDSQEAGRWLRAVLGLEHISGCDRKVSSHSMKCTMLSYLAKRGIEMSDRLLLGYHTSPFTMPYVQQGRHGTSS